jgi:hypothetical protein
VTPQGSCRRHELRLDEVEQHHPGVLSAIVRSVRTRPA